MGSAQYQVRSAQAVVRFWVLGLCLYQYLDAQRARLQQQYHEPVTLGEMRIWVRQRHVDWLLDWLGLYLGAGATADQVRTLLKPALL